MKLTLKTSLHTQPLFNPETTDDDTSVIGARNTNLNNLSNVKYGWARSLYKTMRENFWTPEIVDLTQDDYNKLTDAEKEAFDDVLGFLVYLDSLQTVNLPNISDYITNPEIRGCLIEQTSQEFLHSESYQQIFTTIFTQEEADRIYYRFKENEKLLNRTKFITGLYQKFADEKTLENFLDTIFANIFLEALYFYVGFNYFYNLSANNKMEGVSSMIRLINIDEKSHIGIFTGIINAIKAQADDELKAYIEDRLKELAGVVLQEEFNWSSYVTRNIPTFTDTDIMNYLQHLIESNVMKPLGYSMFPEATNPYRHLSRIANINKSNENKGNFFETKSNAYNHISALSGFREF